MAPCHSRLLSNDDNLDRVLAFVHDGASLMRLRAVSHAMLAAVDGHASRRFNPDKMLKPLIRHVLSFRQLQAKIGAVFSGSRVMKFLEECDYADDSDLDVYVYPGTAGAVGDFLIEVEGYTYVGESWAGDLAAEPSRRGLSLYNVEYVRRVYKFEKGAHSIDVVVASECPLDTILHFHSTPVVNGVTWNRAFSVFAYGAWAKHEGMLLGVKSNPAVAKYRQRGFKIFDARVALSHSFDDYFRTGHRWIGDRDTWVINLKTDGITPPAVLDRLPNTSFRVVGVPVLSGTNCLKTTEYRIETTSFRHSLLEGPTTVSPTAYRFADTVMNCVRKKWLASGAPFTARVTIGHPSLGSETIRRWERLFDLLCTAWRVGRPLIVHMVDGSATFYPLGGTVINGQFV